MIKIFGFLFTITFLVSCDPNGTSESSLEYFNTRNITKFGLSQTKKVALTFDDGPSQNTPELLDILRENNILATFFVTGNSAKRAPETIAQISAEGHILANHTKTHLNLRKASVEKAISEIGYTHDRIKGEMDSDHRLYFRAPFGSWKSSHVEELNRHDELGAYIGPIFWDIGGETRFKNGNIYSAADWECWSKKRSVSECTAGYLNETRRAGGGVVLMHDLRKSTNDMVRLYIKSLVAEGYEFISLDDLRSLDEYETR